jgi:hypothetical protein
MALFLTPANALMHESPGESGIRTTQSEAGISGQALTQVYLGESGAWAVHSPIQKPAHSESQTQWPNYTWGLIRFQEGNTQDANHGFFSPKWISGISFLTIVVVFEGILHHKIPVFYNFLAVQPFSLSEYSAPYHMWFNFDRTFAATILWMCAVGSSAAVQSEKKAAKFRES